MARFYTLTAGRDDFTGASETDNAFNLTSQTLQPDDRIVGNTDNRFLDLLVVTMGGQFLKTQFAGVRGIEQINFSADGNTVTLDDQFVAGTSLNYFALLGGGGNDVIDAGSVNTSLVLFAGGGNISFTGGGGADAIVIAPMNLTQDDTIRGGGGIDNLYLSMGGTVTAAALSGVSGIEGIRLSDQGNDVSLTDGVVAGAEFGSFGVADGAGDDTIDASLVTNHTPIAFFASGGADTFRGGNGANGYVFRMADLTSADSVVGNSGIDNLFMTTAGILAPSAWSNVTGIEGLVLANGANSILLTNSMVSGSSLGYFAVSGGSGNDNIDASAITNGTAIAFYGTAAGDETFLGGNGNDAFLFEAGGMTAADRVTGGAGSDTLWMTTPGTTTAADLTHVSGIEGVLLQAGGAFAFIDGLTTGPVLAGIGSGATDIFDASGVTRYDLIFNGKGGADSLKGGNGNDTFFFIDTAFSEIDGNGGVDRLSLTEDSPSIDLTAIGAKIHDVEVISLDGIDNGSVTLTGDDIPLVSGGALYIVGGPGDSYNAGTGYRQIASGVTNDLVALGHQFYEFQHSNGSLLYIDRFIFDLQPNDPALDVAPENSPVARTVYAGPGNFPSGTAVTYSLGGTDAAAFDIDPVTGNVTFKTSPDFENPGDTDRDNRYDFTVTTTNDRALPTTTRAVTAIVQDANDNAPVFVSASSAATSENVSTSTAVYTAQATDGDGTAANNMVRYAFASQAFDNDAFTINATTGAVAFKVSPDYEAPTDVDHDNQYDIDVLASDSLPAHNAVLHVAISVNDLMFL